MIDFPITDLRDADECQAWLERHLHPQGLACPTCGSSDRRLFRPAYSGLTLSGLSRLRHRPEWHCVRQNAPERGDPGAPATRRCQRGIGGAAVRLWKRVSPPEGTLFFTDEGANDTGRHPQHATVCHGKHEWARDDDGDGRREVQWNSCEGAGAARRTFLRVFHGVHTSFLAAYVATFATLMNAKHRTPAVVQHMCFGEQRHARDSCANIFGKLHVEDRAQAMLRTRDAGLAT